MKKLVMSALLFATAAQAAGCIFVSGDDSSGGTASVSASWTILNDGASAACPPGATTANVTALRSGDSTPYVDQYFCSDGAGDANNLPAGDYTVRVDLTDDSGADLIAQSEDANITLSDGEHASANFEIDGYNGFFDVSWTINDAGGTEVGCAGAVGQNGVSMLATLSGTQEGTDTLVNCTDGEDPAIATTDPVIVGDYVIVLSLLDQADLAIGDSADITARIDHGNEFVDLGSNVITLF